MDAPRHNRGLIALSRFVDGALGFDRWAEALIAALTGASAAEPGFSSWRIVVGYDGSAAPADDLLTAAEAEAVTAGGRLTVVRLEAGGDSFSSFATAMEIEDDSLVLAVDSDVLVLSSTVTRLLRAHEATGSAVSARALPWDGQPAVDQSVDAGDPACVLAEAADLRRARSTPAPCPEAAVVRDRPDQETADEGAASPGSLLEDAVRIGTSSDAAATLVAEALGTLGDPMLSIVMRTQLRRPEALRDVLLCLAAQLDGRFELIVVAHDANLAAVASLLDEQPAWLRQRARVLTAAGGTRSRPLNVGFAAARGTHVAVLDDDDVVTSRWVARFLDAASVHPRRLLRAVAAVQRVQPAEWRDGIVGHAAAAEVTVPYPPVFDLADHLRVNMTPFMALAFPRATLERLGGADETLEVCEDWDLELRAAALLGVVDIPHLTAVYRRWTSGDDSYSLHEQAVWNRDMHTVRAKLDARPLLLPPGSASALAAMSQLRAQPDELAEVYASSSWRATAPLRAVSRFAQRMRRRGGSDGTSLTDSGSLR